MTHPNLITTYRGRAFEPGWNHLLRDDAETGLDFAVYTLQPGDEAMFTDPDREMAVLVLAGAGNMSVDGRSVLFDREEWVHHNPTTAHISATGTAHVTAQAYTELAVIQTRNPASFAPHIYPPAHVDIEHRGQGVLDDTCYRLVKLVFDGTIAPPEARLVVGEVVNFGGRWSSYPPHHHAQPEVYYYRFASEHGYGHAELGDDVMKVRDHDVLKITGERDHSQTAAPGFDMYYLWAVRHLDGNPYTGFEYTPPYGALLD